MLALVEPPSCKDSIHFQMTSGHNSHNLALTENIRKFSNNFAARVESTKSTGSVSEERMHLKLDELWSPLHLLTNLIWELLLEAMLANGNNLEAFMEKESQRIASNNP